LIPLSISLYNIVPIGTCNIIIVAFSVMTGLFRNYSILSLGMWLSIVLIVYSPCVRARVCICGSKLNITTKFLLTPFSRLIERFKTKHHFVIYSFPIRISFLMLIFYGNLCARFIWYTKWVGRPTKVKLNMKQHSDIYLFGLEPMCHPRYYS